MNQSLLVPPNPSVTKPTPTRKPIRLILIGSRGGTTKIIHTLYRLGFAEVGEWSPVLPSRHPGEVMRVLTRHLLEP